MHNAVPVYDINCFLKVRKCRTFPCNNTASAKSRLIPLPLMTERQGKEKLLVFQFGHARLIGRYLRRDAGEKTLYGQILKTSVHGKDSN